MSNLRGEPDGTAGRAEAKSGVVRASAVLAAGTFVSRVLGFASALVLANTLGTQNSGVNAFAIANQLPNNIYALIAGGLLGAVVVPQIVRAALHEDGGQRFINRLVTLSLVIFVLITAVVTLAAPLLVALYASIGDGFSGRELALATAFAYWCLPQVLFYAIYSLLGEVLNARKAFGPYTWAPVVNNVVAIAGLLVFAYLFGASPNHDDAASWTPGMIALIGGSATLGIASQALVLIFFWRRSGLRYRPDFTWRGVGFRQAGRAAAWVFGMVLINQLAGIVETNVVTRAGEDDPSFAVLRFAVLIFMLPHSLVTISIGTAYFTRMSAHARDGDYAQLRSDISTSLRTIVLIIVFAAVGLMVLAYPFSALFTGTFREIQGMGTVVIAYLVGLVPFSVMFVLQRTFYAIDDTRTPFFIQLAQAALFVIGAVFVAQLPPHLVALGIASVTAIAGTAQTVITAIFLRRRIGGLNSRSVIARFWQCIAAVIPAAVAGVALLVAMGGLRENGFAVSGGVEAATSMVVIGLAMALIYLGMLLLMRNRDVITVLAAIRDRLRRVS